jgi:monoamine oxidase
MSTQLRWGHSLTIRQQYALAAAEQEIARVIDNESVPLDDFTPGLGGGLHELPDIAPSNDIQEALEKLSLERIQCPSTAPKVAIVGAGVAGLFLGMMLDYLNEHIPEFKVGYEIFEANDAPRVGGRMFTYNFKPDLPHNPQGPHDYYDVGAMRFPQNAIMQRVFELFDWLEMPMGPLKKDTKNGSLVPYSMTNTTGEVQNEPFRYNDQTRWGSYVNIAAAAAGKDAFGFNKDHRDPPIPSAVLTMSPSKVVDDAIEELRQALKEDAEKGGQRGWELLMKFDQYTTRDWLATNQQKPPNTTTPDPTRPPFNTSTINFLETMNGGTDWYDQAFSETVLESLDFDYDKSTKWWCIMGGAQQLPKLMEKRLKTKPIYSSPVSAIRTTLKCEQPEKLTSAMEVSFQQGDKPSERRVYDGVFNTTTLGCLRRIDTTECSVPNSTKMALRVLAYGESCKVGIKFSSAWWRQTMPGGQRIEKGGLGHSDLHIRTLVYPSYNVLDDPSKPAVLLVSYTWQQDAERIGALISRASPAGEHELKSLLLRELARLHTTTREDEAKLFDTISASYLDHYAHDWSDDATTAGAFAFFRAQQFSTLWPKVVQPAGNLVLIGEASSPHHAWVVGAIESAVAGLYAWLYSRMDIPGAKEAVWLIDGTKPCPSDAKQGHKHPPFLGLPSYLPKKHARWLGLISALRAERAAQKE